MEEKQKQDIRRKVGEQPAAKSHSNTSPTPADYGGPVKGQGELSIPLPSVRLQRDVPWKRTYAVLEVNWYFF